MSKSRSWRISALVTVALLLLTAVVPASALRPTPHAGGPVPVTAADLVREPEAVPAGAQPVAGPASLRNPSRAIQAGGNPEVRALAALGDTRVAVSVQLDKASLASVSRDMTPEQRVAYAAEVAAYQDKFAAEVEAAGGKIVGRFTTLSSGFVADMAGREAARLAAHPGVVSVRQMRDYQLDLSETVPWIGAAQLQALGLTGKGVNVAVIDSGIDYTHKAFGGPGTVDAWRAAYFGSDPACTNGQQAQCASRQMPNPALFGPAAPKVMGGWDYVGESWPGTTAAPRPLAPDPNPVDADYTAPRTGGHGSHVADIIAGLAYEGKGAGVAPDARLWAFKACSPVSTSCSGVAMVLSIDDAADLDNNPATYDPADVINMSIGAAYYQPEDDTVWFSNQAVAYGVNVVASAGNSADKPYITGGPAIADGSISVAQTEVPSAKQFLVNIDSPAAIKGVLKSAVFQSWSTPLATVGAISGTVQYGNADGSNKNGCAAFTDDMTGKVVLMDRGACNFTLKAKNASDAKAVMAFIGLIAPGDPFDGGDGGHRPINMPAFMISQAESNKIKGQLAAGVVISAGPDKYIGLADSVVGSSARGPRNNDGVIKPDIGAPGASVSAIAGGGTTTGAFGGTSGASPMVAGSVALLRGFMKSSWAGMPTWAAPIMTKNLLMNTANNVIYLDGATAAGGGGTLAPITRIGAGQVNVGKAYQTRILAWDSTNQADPLTWAGSLSFGYEAVASTYVETRTLTIANMHPLGQSVWFSNAFRYANDADKGVTVTPLFEGAYIPAGGSFDLPVRMTVDAAKLRSWAANTGLNQGSLGASGTALTTFEVDGYLTISTCDGGMVQCYGETINVPWQVLPKPVAQTAVKSGDKSSVTLANAAPVAASNTDVFALVEQSANLYNYEVGNCWSLGAGPGCNMSPVDMKEIGVRDWNYDMTGDGVPETYVEFGITVWDKPYRSSQAPAEFDIYIDANRDGTDDYVVFNGDMALNYSDGRNATFVYNLSTGAATAYFFTDRTFNSQNWILTAPAAAIGLAPGQQFDFYVLAFDAWFGGPLWDASPFVGAHTYTVGAPRLDVGEANLFPTIDPGAELNLPFITAADPAASPSQVGFLFMYREAPVGGESSVFIPPAGPVYDKPATAKLAASQDAYLQVGMPTTNYGNVAAMYVGGQDALRGVVQFDLSSINAMYPVDKATLRLYVDAFSGPGGAAELRAYDVTTAWAEGSVTWNKPWTKPGGDYVEPAAAAAAVSGASAGKWVEFNVTALAQRWVATPATNMGVILRLRNTADYSIYQLDSRTHWFGDRRPQLVVEYRTP